MGTKAKKAKAAKAHNIPAKEYVPLEWVRVRKQVGSNEPE